MTADHARTAIKQRVLRRIYHHLHLAGIARGVAFSSDGSTRLLGLGRPGGYVLWLPTWWWQCQRTQGFRLRGRHRPREPFVLWTCAACLPCVECGAIYDCVPTCRTGGEAAFGARVMNGSSTPAP